MTSSPAAWAELEVWALCCTHAGVWIVLLLGRKGQGTAVGMSMLTLVFTAAAAELRASSLGWVGGIPAADENP